MKKLTPDISTHSFTQIADEVDRLFQAKLSRATMGLSPAGLTEVYVSWLAHLALCPGRMAALACFPFHHFKDLAVQAMEEPNPAASPDPVLSPKIGLHSHGKAMSICFMHLKSSGN